MKNQAQTVSDQVQENSHQLEQKQAMGGEINKKINEEQAIIDRIYSLKDDHGGQGHEASGKEMAMALAGAVHDRE